MVHGGLCAMITGTYAMERSFVGSSVLQVQLMFQTLLILEVEVVSVYSCHQQISICSLV